MSDERLTTVQWGDDTGGRLGRWSWLGGDTPVFRGAGFGFAIVGFGFLLAAALLPWLSVKGAATESFYPGRTNGEFGLAQTPFHLMAYDIGWIVVLALVGVALVVPPAARRIVGAAGIGAVAGQVVMLISIARAIEGGTAYGFAPGAEVQHGIGMYCAFVAAVLLGMAVVFAGRTPRRRGEEPPDEATRLTPDDLTVTAVPAYEHPADRDTR